MVLNNKVIEDSVVEKYPVSSLVKVYKSHKIHIHKIPTLDRIFLNRDGKGRAEVLTYHGFGQACAGQDRPKRIYMKKWEILAIFGEKYIPSHVLIPHPLPHSLFSCWMG